MQQPRSPSPLRSSLEPAIVWLPRSPRASSHTRVGRSSCFPAGGTASVDLGSPDNKERRLLAEYDTATRFYSWAVTELSRQRGIVSHDEYIKLKQVTDDARKEGERIRGALFKLKDSHPSG